MELFDLVNIINTYGYIGIFSIIFLTSGVFFFTPGDSLLFTGGLLAANGILSIELMVVVVLLATFSGAIAGYEIGSHLKKLYRYAFFKKFIKMKHINKTKSFFEEHGQSTILISRFVAIVRTFTPIVAGMVRMPFGKFLKYSLLGSLIWGLSLPLIAFYLGSKFPGLQGYVPLLVFWIVFISLLPFLFRLLKSRGKIKKKRT